MKTREQILESYFGSEELEDKKILLEQCKRDLAGRDELLKSSSGVD